MAVRPGKQPLLEEGTKQTSLSRSNLSGYLGHPFALLTPLLLAYSLVFLLTGPRIHVLSLAESWQPILVPVTALLLARVVTV